MRLHRYLWGPALLAAAASLFAQTTGSLVGKVIDPTGAAVAQAKVELLNERTGVETAGRSSDTGEYVFPRVDPGSYRLTVTAAGFKAPA